MMERLFLRFEDALVFPLGSGTDCTHDKHARPFPLFPIGGTHFRCEVLAVSSRGPNFGLNQLPAGDLAS